MNKGLQVFMALGLLAVGILVGVLLAPRRDTGDENAGVRIRGTEPAGRTGQGIQGKWEFAFQHTPDAPQSVNITIEFLQDGTFILARKALGDPPPPSGNIEVPPFQADRYIGTWKEIENNRFLITYEGKANAILYSYSIQNGMLKIDGEEPQGGPYIDGTYKHS